MGIDRLLNRLKGLPEEGTLNRIIPISPNTHRFVDPSGNAYECLVLIAAGEGGVHLAHLNTDPAFFSAAEATGLIDELIKTAPENSRIVITGAGTTLTAAQQANAQHIIERVALKSANQAILDTGPITNKETPRRIIIKPIDRSIEIMRYGQSGAPSKIIRY
jgi:hypothetical protein